MSEQAEKLLLEIARCKNFLKSKNTNCEMIVNSQKQKQKQLPEPWNGDIENSKILFISSNPSIDVNEYYPLEAWKNEFIIDFFKNRFSQEKDYVKRNLYPKLNNNKYAKNWVRYWAYIKNISKKLLNKKDVIPGIDYALTEIVHCKSIREYGVPKALDDCVNKYLKRILTLSNAKVIIIVGDKSKKIIEKQIKINFQKNNFTEKIIEGKKRIIFAIPHSNSRKCRVLENVLTPTAINKIREKLNS